MTAGLSAGAATWAFAIEPVAQQVLLQPVPNSKVVQTQGQSVAAPPLRTQQAGAAPAGQPGSNAGPKSEVQRKLEELYQQDGREMPSLPDPQIQRQSPPQGNGAAPSAQQQHGIPARPVSSGAPVNTGAAGAAAQPQYNSWAEAQANGAPRSTQAKKVPWIEQINPFKKRVPSTPPTEPPELHYDPRHAAGVGNQFHAPQYQPPALAGQVNPQTGRQNYSQIFNQPQGFVPQGGVPMTPPQGDPFVATPPMAVAAAPQLTAPGQPIAASPPVQQAPPAAILIPPAQAQAAAPTTPPAGLPILDFGSPVASPVPAPVAQTPVPAAAPAAAFPVLDFSKPLPATPSTVPSSAPPVAAALPALPATPLQTAQLPSAAPQSVVSNTLASPPATPPVVTPAPPIQPQSPFTGLGLNDALPAGTPIPAPAPLVAQSVTLEPLAAPAAIAPAPLVPVTAVPVPLAGPGISQPPTVPQVAALPPAGSAVPKLDGFFSEEEDSQSDARREAAATPRPLVVPVPPADEPKFEVPKPAIASTAAPSVPAAQPADAAPMPAPLPKLELPPVAADSAAPPAFPQETIQPGTIPPLKPVPRQTDPSATSKMARIAARSDQRGLKGFCPVMLRDHRELVDAKAEYRSFYRNRIILLSSQEAKMVFESDPAKYAPAAAGNDVIHLSQTGEELEGSLEFAVWYKGRLYLFASAETLENFVAAPSSHATND